MKTGNEGPDIPGVGEVDDPPEIEMAAFDALGPRARTAINDMVVPWSSRATLEMVLRQKLNPVNPIHDSLISEQIRRADTEIRRRIKNGDPAFDFQRT